jgi:parvulin-like peptidyl-prolyl isomerase
MKRTPLYFVAAATCLVFLAGCGVGNVAATVNGRDIPASKIDHALQQFVQTEAFKQQAQQAGGPEKLKRQFEQGYLSRLIQRAVLSPAAKRMGVTVSDDEVQRQIDQIKESNFKSEEDFKKALEQQGLTLQTLRELVGDDLLQSKLHAKVVAGSGPSKADIERAYSEQRASFRQWRASHILVKDLGRAQKLTAELRRMPKPQLKRKFAELAKKYSEDPASKVQGGDLGWVNAGQFAPQFEDALRHMKVGEISDPVRTQFGFHVIWLTGKRIQPLSQVTDELEAQLQQTSQEERWRRFIRRIYTQAHVKVNPRYGEFHLSSQQVVDPVAGTVPGTSPSPTPENPEAPIGG